MGWPCPVLSTNSFRCQLVKSISRPASPSSAGQSITWSVSSVPVVQLVQSISQSGLNLSGAAAISYPGYIYVLAARHAQRRDVCGVDSAAAATAQLGSAVYRRPWTVRAGGRRMYRSALIYRPHWLLCGEKRQWPCKQQEGRTGPHQTIKTCFVYPGQSEMILQDKLFLFSPPFFFPALLKTYREGNTEERLETTTTTTTAKNSLRVRRRIAFVHPYIRAFAHSCIRAFVHYYIIFFFPFFFFSAQVAVTHTHIHTHTQRRGTWDGKCVITVRTRAGTWRNILDGTSQDTHVRSARRRGFLSFA